MHGCLYSVYSGCDASFPSGDSIPCSYSPFGHCRCHTFASHVSGCGSAVDVYWPPGTSAVLCDRDAPRVLAKVPIEQRAMIKRRSLAIANNTPVAIVEDPSYRARSRSATRSESPDILVRVRVMRASIDETK